MKTKLIGWDGITFQAPVGWEVDGVGPGYLRLDDGRATVMEMKFQNRGGDFTRANHFKQLTKRMKSKASVEIQKTVLPSDWKKGITGFESTAFMWRAEQVAGKGVVLYKDKTKTAILIQFFSVAHRTEAEKSGYKEGVDMVLSTMATAPKSGPVNWAVFDMRFTAPIDLGLGEHEFKPGMFKIEVKNKDQSYTFFRYSPARAILENETLTGFIFRQFHADFQRAEPEPEPWGFNGLEAAVWATRDKSGAFSALQSRLTKRPNHAALVAFHLPDQGRILAVLGKSRSPVDKGFLVSLAEDFHVVS